MKMRYCLVLRYPGQRWRNAVSSAVVLAVVACPRRRHNDELRAASDPLIDLKTGCRCSRTRAAIPAAIAAFKGLPQRLPKLADYAAWFLASAQSASQDYAAVSATLDPVFKQSPPSPLVPRAALLAAGALTQNDNPAAAFELLRKYYSVLSQPKGDFAMATAFAASGDTVSAAIYYQRVYYGFPASAEAAACCNRD